MYSHLLHGQSIILQSSQIPNDNLKMKRFPLFELFGGFCLGIENKLLTNHCLLQYEVAIHHLFQVHLHRPHFQGEFVQCVHGLNGSNPRNEFNKLWKFFSRFLPLFTARCKDVTCNEVRLLTKAPFSIKTFKTFSKPEKCWDFNFFAIKPLQLNLKSTNPCSEKERCTF